MPSGTLAQAALAANTNTVVYTVPTGKLASVSVSICNRGSTVARVRVAVAAAATPIDAEYIEYDVPVDRDSFEITGLVMSADKNLVVYADSPNISVNVYGYEE